MSEHRFPRRVVLCTVAGTASLAVALGGGAVALASGPGSSSGSSSGSSAPSAPTPPANAPKPSPHMDGTVVSTSGDTIVITDPEGFQRTIHVTSSTKYGNGLSASSVTSGKKIHAEGTVDSDKTSLDATSIGTMPTPPQGGKPPAPPARGNGNAKPPTPPSGSNAPKPPSGSNAPKPPSGSNAPSAPSGGSGSSSAPTPSHS